MLIDFASLPETTIPRMYGGEGEVHANMYASPTMKIMKGKLPPGATIGLHTHQTSSEIIYILEGSAAVLYDGEKLRIEAGQVHYCPDGHAHSLINDTERDLVFFAVVPQQ